MLLRSPLAAVLLLCAFQSAMAQRPVSDSIAPAPQPVHVPSKWYEKISIKGYSQFRYNRLLESNPDLKCEQCDRGIGKNQTFEFRRARLTLSGNIHERVFLYLQFDYSADASDNNKHFLQVRDAYADIALDKKKKEYRFRVGQSKVIYSFDVLQSSSIRLPFDRSDALNSGAPNERDMGVYFMYAPAKIRDRFKRLIEEGLKGSGDYGVFSIGLYNGQTMNKPELNDKFHVAARLSCPLQFGRQIIEPGIQAYHGKYTLAADKLSAGVKYSPDNSYTDQRAAASLVLFPQPFGIQAEYTIGEGPGFDPRTDSISVRNLKGGYVTACYRTKFGKGQAITPYLRYQVYEGSKKHETDARYHDIKETEFGTEWEPFKNLTLKLGYVISHRIYDQYKKHSDEKGNFLRFQLQLNY